MGCMFMTLDVFLNNITMMFKSVIGMVGDVGTTIAASPILIFFIALPVIGIAVGLFRRLLNVN